MRPLYKALAVWEAWEASGVPHVTADVLLVLVQAKEATTRLHLKVLCHRRRARETTHTAIIPPFVTANVYLARKSA